jgi:putative DNA primase/helicase
MAHTWFCSQCPKQSGDGFALLMGVQGIKFPEALEAVARQVGVATETKVRVGKSDDQVRAEMAAIWRGSRAIEDVDAAAAYLIKRVGVVPEGPNLRAVQRLPFMGGRQSFPALVAKVHNLEGKWVQLHRTYLSPGGEKAPVDDPRWTMARPIPPTSAVRLFEAGPILGVAEGIETALSCHAMFGVPTWATINAGNMRTFIPPAGVRKVVIFGDHDVSFTGQAASFELARLLWARRKKHDPWLDVEIRIEGVSLDMKCMGRDWNDTLMEQLEREASCIAAE